MKKINLILLIIFGKMILFTACNEEECVETTWFQDLDEDGQGNPDVSIQACEQPTGYVADNSDTFDCIESNWYQDLDGDGLGNPDVSITACEQPNGYVADDTDTEDIDYVTIDVIGDEFLTDGTDFTIPTVPCTLSDGTATNCYQIVTNNTPTDHEMGPWCPDSISDSAEAGGIWLEGGEVYDVDGAFIENMANLYNDDNWLMYDN